MREYVTCDTAAEADEFEAKALDLYEADKRAEWSGMRFALPQTLPPSWVAAGMPLPPAGGPVQWCPALGGWTRFLSKAPRYTRHDLADGSALIELSPGRGGAKNQLAKQLEADSKFNPVTREVVEGGADKFAEKLRDLDASPVEEVRRG